MIKKPPFLLTSFLICCFSFAQQIAPNPNDCIQNFTLNVKTLSVNNQRVDDIILSWDFSQNTNTQNIELSYEVQPLNSCWKGLEGTNRSETKTFKIANFSENITGNQKLEYNDLICKCIKWRAIIIDTTTNCEVKTNWQFTSFL
nr:hypothetical protein [uncultured Psychroserpens sp.]